MAKTLSESAAEILKASMNAGKEPMQHMAADVSDLGGQTPTQLPTDIGAKAAADVKEAPKPGAAGVPAEGMKKAPATAKKIGDEEEGLKKNPVDAGSVKAEETEVEVEGEVVTEEEAALEEGKTKLAMPMAVKAKKSMTEEEESVETEEVAEISEEEIVEAKKKMMKDMVAKHKGSMAEDVNALFNGESLSEEFRTKATTIFEAAVQSRVEKVVEEVLSENDEVLAEAYEEIKNELTAQVDEYLNYVVEQWMEENKLAIETGLRAELSEDFINGLKNLFAEHYIELPEEKVDVAEELAVKVVELEESSLRAAEEAAAKIKSLSEELNAAKKHEAIRKICEGLTEVQVEKMKSLAEGVEFTTEGEFGNKLAVLRENYFPVNKVKSEVKALEETTVSEDQPEVAQVHGLMSHYVKAITKTVPKV